MRRAAGAGFGIAALALALITMLFPVSSRSTDAGATVDHARLAPILLTVDDAAAPLAVAGSPRFGWVPRDPDRGEVQTAYELVVGEVPVAGGPARPIWRSDKVQSAEQAHVTAPTLPLQPDRSYTWKVRTWDRTSRVGPFSAPAYFDLSSVWIA